MGQFNNKPKVAESGLYGYKSTAKYALLVCPYCKETYRRFEGEVEYIFDGLKFCSFPCKNRYRKEHPEKDLTFAEQCQIKISKKQKPPIKNKVIKKKTKTQSSKTDLIKQIINLDPSEDIRKLFTYKKDRLIEILKEKENKQNDKKSL